MSESPTSGPATEATNNEPRVSVHRWPWRTEEFISMLVAASLVLALGYFVFTSRVSMMSSAIATAWIAFTVIAALGSVYYLYRVKKKRTDTSQVTITIIGTVVRSESKGPLGKSQVDVAKTETVSYRRYNSDETFMISAGDQSARVPLRATKDAHVREMVELAFTNAANVSSEARDLHVKMRNGDAPK